MEKLRVGELKIYNKKRTVFHMKQVDIRDMRLQVS